jgi:FkbM family methyltransferase
VKDFLRRVVKSIPPLYRQYNRFRGWRIDDPDTMIPFIEMGGDKGVHNYGAWVVPEGLLTARSTVYSFGVGEDISFDLELIQRYGCYVYAFDPTPNAARFVQQITPESHFIFSQIGLSNRDGTAFFTDQKRGDTSLGVTNSANITGQSVYELPVNRLSTLMTRNGHNRIDLLKMDIEGLEYDVIDDMLAICLLPQCIILEFHHYQRKDPQSTQRAVRQLRAAGYSLFWVSQLGAEYGFWLSHSPVQRTNM